MSLISSFLISHLVPALESAFINHEPEVQAALLKEVEALAAEVGQWIASKMAASAAMAPVAPAVVPSVTAE